MVSSLAQDLKESYSIFECLFPGGDHNHTSTVLLVACCGQQEGLQIILLSPSLCLGAPLTLLYIPAKTRD